MELFELLFALSLVVCAAALAWFVVSLVRDSRSLTRGFAPPRRGRAGSGREPVAPGAVGADSGHTQSYGADPGLAHAEVASVAGGDYSGAYSQSDSGGSSDYGGGDSSGGGDFGGGGSGGGWGD